MKTMTKRIATVVAGSLIVAGTFTACTHHRFHDPEKRGEWMVEKVTDELDLNDSQKSKLEAVRQEILVLRNQTKVNRESTRQEIIELLDQPKLDRQKVLSIVEQKTSKINQHAPQLVNTFGEFYDSLSSEQREEIKEHLADMGKHHHHW